MRSSSNLAFMVVARSVVRPSRSEVSALTEIEATAASDSLWLVCFIRSRLVLLLPRRAKASLALSGLMVTLRWARLGTFPKAPCRAERGIAELPALPGSPSAAPLRDAAEVDDGEDKGASAGAGEGEKKTAGSEADRWRRSIEAAGGDAPVPGMTNSDFAEAAGEEGSAGRFEDIAGVGQRSYGSCYGSCTPPGLFLSSAGSFRRGDDGPVPTSLSLSPPPTPVRSFGIWAGAQSGPDGAGEGVEDKIKCGKETKAKAGVTLSRVSTSTGTKSPVPAYPFIFFFLCLLLLDLRKISTFETRNLPRLGFN